MHNIMMFISGLFLGLSLCAGLTWNFPSPSDHSPVVGMALLSIVVFVFGCIFFEDK